MAELLTIAGAAVVYKDPTGKARYAYAPALVPADAMADGERDRLVEQGLLVAPKGAPKPAAGDGKPGGSGAGSKD